MDQHDDRQPYGGRYLAGPDSLPRVGAPVVTVAAVGRRPRGSIRVKLTAALPTLVAAALTIGSA